MFEKLTPIIEKFQVKGEVLRILPIEIGHINQTYQVVFAFHQQEKSFILQRINTLVFQQPKAVMENIVKVGQYLRQQQYPKDILYPIPTREGLFFAVDRLGGYWRMFPFIKNTQTFNAVNSAEKAWQAAFAFGEYMHYLNDFDAAQLHYTIPDFHNTNLRYQQFFETCKKANVQRANLAKTSMECLHEFRYLIGPMQRLKLPLRAVHSDTKINNVLFDKNTGLPVCVIDLDTLMPGTLIYDYGDMVRTFTPTFDENSNLYEEIKVRKDILTALTEGYLEGLQGSITPLEKSLLFYGAKLIIFEQALRFLMDYLQGNIYYKVAYEEQNLVRAKNQICLLQDLMKIS